MVMVLYFTTTWCNPCKVFSPVVQEVCAALNIPMRKIDAEEDKVLAEMYSITGVPTLVILKGSTILHRNTGVMSKTQLTSMLKNL